MIANIIEIEKYKFANFYSHEFENLQPGRYIEFREYFHPAG